MRIEALRLAIHRLHRRKRDVVVETGQDWNADGALLVPAIDRARRGALGVQAVVLVGSGQAVTGVAEQSLSLSRRGREFRVVSLHPDDDARQEIGKVSSSPEVIVTTPARLIDHIRRDNIDLSHVSSCTIDATGGTDVEQFNADLHFIYTKLPKNSVTTAFVSKLGQQGEELMDLMRRPSSVSVESWRDTAEPNSEPTEERRMADKRPFDKDELKAKIKEIIRAIHSDEDPADLNAYKRFVKKNVSVFTRGYFTAYLLKYSGVQAPRSQDQTRGERSRGRSSGAKPSEAKSSDPNKASIFVSIGRNRRVHSRDLVTLFTSTDGVTESDLGQVKVLDNYSFVEIETAKAQQAIDALNGSDFRGRKLTVNFARKR